MQAHLNRVYAGGWASVSAPTLIVDVEIDDHQGLKYSGAEMVCIEGMRSCTKYFLRIVIVVEEPGHLLVG